MPAPRKYPQELRERAALRSPPSEDGGDIGEEEQHVGVESGGEER